MATTTIQERLRQLCELLDTTPEKLSVAAGLSRGYISRIIHSKDRTGMSPDAGERIAFKAKVSRRWLLFGDGHPFDNDDVPKAPPPPKHRVARESLPYWVETAKLALGINPGLAWAVMGVGEQLAADPTETLNEYDALAEAVRFRDTCQDRAERVRLDRKGRAFQAAHAPAPKGRSEHPSKGSRLEVETAIEPQKKRRSSPP